MSERRKPHNGRDKNGQHHTKLEDVEDLLTEPEGEIYVKDDVRTGGAVIDVGPHAGERAEEIQGLVDENREIVNKLARYNRGL